MSTTGKDPTYQTPLGAGQTDNSNGESSPHADWPNSKAGSPTPDIKVPFFKPSIGQAEIDDVIIAMRQGWVTMGPKVREFEQSFADYIGGDIECVAINSATAGMHLVLEALGLGPGDEVIIPVNTFTATAEVVRYLGAQPVFVDIDFATMNIDVEAFATAITQRTKVVMPVHIAGLPANMTQIIKIARAHNIKIVEDAAHALPAAHAGTRVGALDSDATIFSFYATKTITTGEGGMIATRNKAITNRCKIMRLHGIDRDAFERRYTDGNAWHYDVVAPGFKYNMTDISASIGVQQLKRADVFQAQRNELVKQYQKELADLPLTLPPTGSQDDQHAWHLFIIRLHDTAKTTRDDLIANLAAMGIICSVHFIPLHKMSYWQKSLNLSGLDFPNAEKNFQYCLSLPLYPGMTSQQLHLTVSAIKQCLA